MKIFKIVLAASIAINLYAVDFKDASSHFKRETPERGVVVSYYDSIKDAKKAVVNISTQKRVKGQSLKQLPFFNDPFFRDFFGKGFEQTIPQDRIQRSLGSGVIVSSDGYIITNNHVVGEADKITVTLPQDSSKEYKAKLIGSDPKSDVAVIKIDEKDLPFIKFANSSKVKVGDVVFAIGNPFGVGETVTSGIVSALNKSGVGINAYENFIQTDASINPGNSGGALVDSRGALVGINTAIISKTGGNVGIGFAIPSNMAKVIAKALIDTGKVSRGYVGVSIGDITPDLKKFYKDKKGAFVIDVQKDSPAYKAGIKRGDLIVGIDTQTIKNAADLRNKIGLKAPKSQVVIRYIRDGKEFFATVTLAQQDTQFLATKGGARVLDGLIVVEKDDTVIVQEVEQASKAHKKGFKKGDKIVQINQMDIHSLKDLKKALRIFKDKNKIVYFQRGGSIYYVVI